MSGSHQIPASGEGIPDASHKFVASPDEARAGPSQSHQSQIDTTMPAFFVCSHCNIKFKDKQSYANHLTKFCPNPPPDIPSSMLSNDGAKFIKPNKKFDFDNVRDYLMQPGDPRLKGIGKLSLAELRDLAQLHEMSWEQAQEFISGKQVSAHVLDLHKVMAGQGPVVGSSVVEAARRDIEESEALDKFSGLNVHERLKLRRSKKQALEVVRATIDQVLQYQHGASAHEGSDTELAAGGSWMAASYSANAASILEASDNVLQQLRGEEEALLHDLYFLGPEEAHRDLGDGEADALREDVRHRLQLKEEAGVSELPDQGRAPFWKALADARLGDQDEKEFETDSKDGRQKRKTSRKVAASPGPKRHRHREGSEHRRQKGKPQSDEMKELLEQLKAISQSTMQAATAMQQSAAVLQGEGFAAHQKQAALSTDYGVQFAMTNTFEKVIQQQQLESLKASHASEQARVAALELQIEGAKTRLQAQSAKEEAKLQEKLLQETLPLLDAVEEQGLEIKKNREEKETEEERKVREIRQKSGPLGNLHQAHWDQLYNLQHVQVDEGASEGALRMWREETVESLIQQRHELEQLSMEVQVMREKETQAQSQGRFEHAEWLREQARIIEIADGLRAAMPEGVGDWDPVNGVIVHLSTVSSLPQDIEKVRIVLAACVDGEMSGQAQATDIKSSYYSGLHGEQRAELNSVHRFTMLSPSSSLHLMAELQVGSGSVWRCLAWISLPLLCDDFSLNKGDWICPLFAPPSAPGCSKEILLSGNTVILPGLSLSVVPATDSDVLPLSESFTSDSDKFLVHPFTIPADSESIPSPASVSDSKTAGEMDEGSLSPVTLSDVRSRRSIGESDGASMSSQSQVSMGGDISGGAWVPCLVPDDASKLTPLVAEDGINRKHIAVAIDGCQFLPENVLITKCCAYIVDDHTVKSTCEGQGLPYSPSLSPLFGQACQTQVEMRTNRLFLFVRIQVMDASKRVSSFGCTSFPLIVDKTTRRPIHLTAPVEASNLSIMTGNFQLPLRYGDVDCGPYENDHQYQAKFCSKVSSLPRIPCATILVRTFVSDIPFAEESGMEIHRPTTSSSEASARPWQPQSELASMLGPPPDYASGAYDSSWSTPAGIERALYARRAAKLEKDVCVIDALRPLGIEISDENGKKPADQLHEVWKNEANQAQISAGLETTSLRFFAPYSPSAGIKIAVSQAFNIDIAKGAVPTAVIVASPPAAIFGHSELTSGLRIIHASDEWSSEGANHPKFKFLAKSIRRLPSRDILCGIVHICLVDHSANEIKEKVRWLGFTVIPLLLRGPGDLLYVRSGMIRLPLFRSRTKKVFFRSSYDGMIPKWLAQELESYPCMEVLQNALESKDVSFLPGNSSILVQVMDPQQGPLQQNIAAAEEDSQVFLQLAATSTFKRKKPKNAADSKSIDSINTSAITAAICAKLNISTEADGTNPTSTEASQARKVKFSQ